MGTTTSMQGLPVPVLSDEPNIPADMTALALAIEKKLVGTYTSAADRNSKVTSPVDGQFALLKDSHTLTMWNASLGTPAWVQIYPTTVPTFTVGTSTPSNTDGNNGDVYLKTNVSLTTDVDWTAITLGSGWTRYSDTSYAAPAYCRRGGIVYLRGLVHGDGTSQTICTLPTGFRPSGGLMIQMTGAAVITSSAGSPAHTHGLGDIPVRGDMISDGRIGVGSANVNFNYISLSSIPPYPAA